MEIPLLKDIVVIFGLSTVVLFLSHRLRVPVIVGFLVTGILAGPHGFGLIQAVHQVETLAEIGVVLLLFTIGMEFSLDHLGRIKRSVLIGGTLQVGLTFLAGAAITWMWGLSLQTAIFVGFLLSLSSTAIVLKVLQERAEIDSPHGQITLGILIFQDIVIVPMMLLTPVLSGSGGQLAASLLSLAVKGIGIVLLVLVGARWVVPHLLYLVAQTRSREIFLLSIMLVCFAVAWLTSEVGLSLALGAFLAGLIISESEYSHQALGNILPFRDVFTSFFFVSIGMLLDISYVLGQPLLVLSIAAGVIVIKSVLGGLAALALGFPIRTALLTGVSVAQVGEFSFILAAAGASFGLFTPEAYQLFLAVSIITMALTPFIIVSGPGLTKTISRLPFLASLGTVREEQGAPQVPKQTDHLVIIGFGINGHNLARAARASGIAYIVVETNPETVKVEKARGEPIFYGDATQEGVLRHANLEAARVLVIAISDPIATRRIIELARRLNPKVHIIARTRFVQEMKPLYQLGADQVIPEEFETSVEIFTRVLRKYLVPRDEVEQFVSQVRSDGYEMFRELSKVPYSIGDLRFYLSEDEISTVRVSDDSRLIGMTLSEIDLRNRHGLTLLAVKRQGQVISNPLAGTKLCPGDILMLLGEPGDIAKAAELFA